MKKVAIISKDRPTVRLIDILLTNEKTAVEAVASVSELAASSAIPSLCPDLIIYDYPEHSKEDGLLCRMLMKHTCFDETPRLVLSTFPMECEPCPGYRTGRCGHILKPFNINHVRSAVKELTKDQNH